MGNRGDLYHSTRCSATIEGMDSLPDLVWGILLEKGAEVQMKYDTYLSDAMPKPKRKFVTESKVWDDLLEATMEALKRLRVQMIEESKHYSEPGPVYRRKESEDWGGC